MAVLSLLGIFSHTHYVESTKDFFSSEKAGKVDDARTGTESES